MVGGRGDPPVLDLDIDLIEEDQEVLTLLAAPQGCGAGSTTPSATTGRAPPIYIYIYIYIYI